MVINIDLEVLAISPVPLHHCTIKTNKDMTPSLTVKNCIAGILSAHFIFPSIKIKHQSEKYTKVVLCS